MQFGFNERCLDHDTGARHPENPDRLRSIREGLKRRHGVEYVSPQPAPRTAIESVHDPAYVADVEAFCRANGGEWDPDTIASEDTYEAALASAGLATWAAETALEGADGRKTPFALGRPPGHHATVDDAMGFCFFNNAAVAAEIALGREDVERVAIIDWDVHHGNGTQAIFYDRADVLYASIHERGLFPGTGEIDELGSDDGTGQTVNVPLSAGAGDSEYLHIVERLLTPTIERMEPDLLLVSAGFDAHEHDPISRMRVTTEGFGLLTDRLRRLGESVAAPLAFILEGGYGLETLAEGVAAVHETFDGRPPVEPEEPPDEESRQVVADLRERLSL